MSPKGSKFFPIRVNPFSEEMLINFERVTSHENVSFPISPAKSESSVLSILNYICIYCIYKAI